MLLSPTRADSCCWSKNCIQFSHCHSLQ
jgi:hypothetical protein